jgi:hypothetical protein
MIRRRNCFRQAIRGVGLSEHRLALQIREFNEVAIDNPEIADAGAGQRLGLRGSERAAADNYDPSLRQLPLAFYSDCREKDLTAVSFGAGLRIQIEGP